jgi:hypothetical protein
LKKTNLVLVFSLLGLILLSGCLKVNYDGEQTFMDDGTSTLVIEEYVGLNKDALSGLGSTTKTEDASSIALAAMVDYYGSSEYSSFLCNMMDGDEVDECEAKSDGSIKATLKLKPNDFYQYSSETDWLNLVEKKTYTIDQVPFANYYVLKEGGSDYQDKLQADLAEYVKDNIGNYLKSDAYCTGSYSYECKVKSMAANTATVELSTSYGTSKILWAACSAQDSSYFLFLNESEAKSELISVTNVGKTLTSTTPLTVSLTCPSNSKSLVIAYEKESLFSGTTTGIDALDFVTKQGMSEEVIESLNKSTSTSSLGSTTSTDYEDYVINFKKSEVLGSDFDEFSKLGDSSASMMSMDVSVEYTAVFPADIKNATVGSQKVDFTGKELTLDMDDLEDLPKGSLTVLAEKQLSPLGIFTWLVPLAILLGLIIAFLLSRRQ